MTTQEKLKNAFMELNDLNSQLPSLCQEAYSVARNNGGFDLKTTPQAKAWHKAIRRIEEIEGVIPKLKEQKIREENPGPGSFIVLVIEELSDWQEYSSRVAVTTKVFGPYADEKTAQEKADKYADSTVIETCGGVPVKSVVRNYGHAE